MSLADVIAAAFTPQMKGVNPNLDPLKTGGVLPPGPDFRVIDATPKGEIPLAPDLMRLFGFGGDEQAAASGAPPVGLPSLGWTPGATPVSDQLAADDAKREQVFTAFLDNLAGGPQAQRGSFTLNGVPMPQVSTGGGGYMSMPQMDTSLIMPDFSKANAALEAARPKDYQADKEDPVYGMLAGLAAAASQVGEDSSVGSMLLQLGAGMLGGVIQARNGSKEEQQRAAERKAEYELKVAGVAAEQAQIQARAYAENQALKNDVALQKMRVAAANAEAAASAARAGSAAAMARWEAAQPKITFDSQGNANIQQYNPDTGQITFTREPLARLMAVKGQADAVQATGGGFGDANSLIVDSGLSRESVLTVMLKRIDDLGALPSILGDAGAQKFEELFNKKLTERGISLEMYTGDRKNEALDNERMAILRQVVYESPEIQQAIMEMVGGRTP